MVQIRIGISIKKDQSKNASNSYIGHTRLKTHGNEEQDENNQPVFSEDISIVHNGIVVNYQKILKDFNLKLSSELDSEIIVLLLDYYLKNSNINEALPQTIENLSGEVSIAGTYKKGEYFFLYTNTGSIYYVLNKNKLMYFSSEEWITKKIKSKYKIAGDIYKLEANNGLIFDSNYLKINNFFQECLGEEFKKPSLDEIIQTFKKKEIVKPVLKRCNKCIDGNKYINGAIKNINIVPSDDLKNKINIEKNINDLADNKKLSINTLNSLIENDKNLENQAYAHYNIWKYNNDGTSKKTSLKIYKELYKKSPKHQYKIIIKALN